MSKKCSDTNKQGDPCGAYAIEGSDYCVYHDPGKAAQRAAWRRSGGRATRKGNGEPVELMDLDGVRQGLAAVIGSLWELSNTAERNRALISAYSEARKMFEVGDLEERMEALEQRIEQLKIAEARMQT